MFAVVKVGSRQYKVAPKDIITVDAIPGKVGDTVELTDVLLLRLQKAVKVGKPRVEGGSVTAKILAQEKGEKIFVRRFKSKVRYRRNKGFRPHLTKLEILKIS